MATRSIVGLNAHNGDWFGRYVHWDGYPEGVGAAVWHIVKRDGVSEAFMQLVISHHSWSALTTESEPDTAERRDSLKFVKGYGYAHTDGVNEFIQHDGDKCGAEYAYLIDHEGMRILKIDFDGNITEGGFYRWDAGEPHFVVSARERFGVAV